MENKKLLKFLLKDIAELEELFSEKGSSGFDSYEIEFIRSRFKGAKEIIRILDEKQEPEAFSVENPPLEEQKNHPTTVQTVMKEEVHEKTNEQKIVQDVVAPETEVVHETMTTEEPLKESVSEQEIVEEEIETNDSGIIEDKIQEENVEERNSDENSNSDVELDEEVEIKVNKTLGDSFLKEKSVNDLVIGGNGKLENKLSNSPVKSIQGAIGINDRYQYIRELFDGSAESFAKTVNDLDNLNTIQEAVTYLQQNHKWKKNETSLKFVNLVKRRFANG